MTYRKRGSVTVEDLRPPSRVIQTRPQHHGRPPDPLPRDRYSGSDVLVAAWWAFAVGVVVGAGAAALYFGLVGIG